MKNDITVMLDVPARIIDNRTLVPIRFISEAFGATVEYNEEANIVIINTKSEKEELK